MKVTMAAQSICRTSMQGQTAISGTKIATLMNYFSCMRIQLAFELHLLLRVPFLPTETLAGAGP